MADKTPAPTGRQSDAEIAALAKINKVLLAMAEEERQRTVAWLHDRHAARFEVAK